MRPKYTTTLTILAGLAVGLGLVGCEEDEDHDHHEHLEHRHEWREERGSLPGTQQQAPATAVAMDGWNQGHLSWRTPQSGTIYVFDSDGSHLVYIAHVDAGAQVEIDATQHQGAVDGQTVFTEGDGGYQVFFEPDSVPSPHASPVAPRVYPGLLAA